MRIDIRTAFWGASGAGAGWTVCVLLAWAAGVPVDRFLGAAWAGAGAALGVLATRRRP